MVCYLNKVYMSMAPPVPGMGENLNDEERARFQGLSSLEILYMSNNNLKDFSELEKLSGLSLLRDVLFVGNPMYEGLSPEEQRINVLKFLPNVQKIDGDMVKPAEREAAAAAE